MRIALAIPWRAPSAANLALVEDYTCRAADAGATLVVFPEGTMSRFQVPLAPVAEPLDGPWADGVRGSRPTPDHRAGRDVHPGYRRPRHQHAARGGSGVTPTTTRSTSTTHSASPSPTTSPRAGSRVVVTVDGVGVGLTLCYDIRFPSLYTELADRGARHHRQRLVGAGPGKLEQWTLLARARALDSTCFIAAVWAGLSRRRAGQRSAPTGVGGSRWPPPAGEIVASAGADPQLVVTD